MKIDIDSEAEMKTFGARLGALLNGGETIELVGDVGAGKTTLTKGISSGLGVDEDVQSPSFTISRVYKAREDIELAHYDFYRLQDAGIMSDDLMETIQEPKTVTIIEWATIVKNALPSDYLMINITPKSETQRQVKVEATGERSKKILEALV